MLDFAEVQRLLTEIRDLEQMRVNWLPRSHRYVLILADATGELHRNDSRVFQQITIQNQSAVATILIRRDSSDLTGGILQGQYDTNTIVLAPEDRIYAHATGGVAAVYVGVY